MLPSPQRPFQRIKGAGNTPGLRINEDASSGRTEILGFLRAWSALVADECSVRKPAGQDCGPMASFLLEHLDWLLAHPAAGDFDEEIYALTAHVLEIADSAPRQCEIGPCVRPGCDARLYVVVSASSGKHEVHCKKGHVWQANQWLRLYRQIQGA
ncbi:hypothetical protein [Actinomadura mexicana]|uniref:Uncharacterized protein n=1 Tax=Actinomadura mexicana TaxID=134959 RepID=A0A238XMQ6_9ACTN|nr:hypothetical protein [Actinomadura mexicana]SNR59259.1 hypothetical protein SAMN06265355_104433 [Actinomadura mexicana]